MPFLTAEGISKLVVELLSRALVLPQTVLRVPGRDFSGPNGATVTIRVPKRRTANEQITPGTDISGSFAAIDEDPISLTVHHLFDAALVTDEDLTLGIEAFGRQVSAPQVAAVAELAEDQLAEVMNDMAAAFPLTGNIEDDVLQAREMLTDNRVPAGRRYLAVSPDVATEMLKLDKFSRVDTSGSPSALRDAVLGKIYGLTVVESNALSAGTGVAYHESGFAFASLSPAIPQGASSAAQATANGIAIRQLFAFIPAILSDVSVVSTFAGAVLVDADRVVKIGEVGS